MSAVAMVMVSSPSFAQTLVRARISYACGGGGVHLQSGALVLAGSHGAALLHREYVSTKCLVHTQEPSV